jgi:hypothetical protein
MELRTTLSIDPSPDKITYNDKVMLIGSCFATSIGCQMVKGKLEAMINPTGTVYNPASVCAAIDIITKGREFKLDDLLCHDGMWHSFFHYTDFSSDDPARALGKINKRTEAASAFLKSASYLFITFGTARIYRWKKTGLIVSNCHKIPSADFTRELLPVDVIVELWTKQLDRLKTLYPSLKIIFTISPVRHLKDSAHGNHVSKSVLFLAVEELLKHPSGPRYFPAYELVMDDLRDYRFYDDDMIHPSAAAINYIWEAFTGCYFDSTATKTWNEAVKITSAFTHKFNTDSKSGRMVFAENMLKRIDNLESKIPSINFSEEKGYFLRLLRGGDLF